MLGELAAEPVVDQAVVGVQFGLAAGLGDEDLAHGLGGDVGDVLARISPPRSTSATTGCFFGTGLPLWTFLALPPTKVSSLSTILPSPPSGPAVQVTPSMASRMRCIMNHAV